MRFIVAILILLILSGCSCGAESTSKSNKDDGSKNYRVVEMGSKADDLKVYHDPKNNVTCYRVAGQSGLSCLKNVEQSTTSETN